MTKLISFYGDDFTGSTDVLEALSTHGVDTVLFTRIPTPVEYSAFADHQAIGLAGTSRSQTPEWMEQHLPEIFTWLKSLGAQFCHYKVCSTFDSSPSVGNIGRASEIGAREFSQAVIPLIVGASQLKRYTFSGHLFAGYQGETYRIDRHPVMSRHPVTPMHEADLRLHLALQTEIPTQLANTAWPSTGLGLVDVHDAATQLAAGEKLLNAPQNAQPFIVGSSGVEYALMKALTARSRISGHATYPTLDAVQQCVVVSGSVSPTTERQIQAARQKGFATVPLSPIALAQSPSANVTAAVEQCLQILASGRSPLVHTAMGTTSDQSAALNDIPDARQNVGTALGQILREVLERTNLRRAIIAGGDSSSLALGQLDIYALKMRFPLTATPGSPLCTATSNNPKLNGLEIAMKGGQVGGDGYFIQLRDGI